MLVSAALKKYTKKNEKRKKSERVLLFLSNAKFGFIQIYIPDRQTETEKEMKMELKKREEDVWPVFQKVDDNAA